MAASDMVILLISLYESRKSTFTRAATRAKVETSKNSYGVSESKLHTADDTASTGSHPPLKRQQSITPANTTVACYEAAVTAYARN